MKRTLCLAVALSFFAQNTGAADLAAGFAAARPGHLAFPHAQMAANPRPAAPSKKGPALSDRLSQALRTYSDDLFTVVSWGLDRLYVPETALAPASAPAIEEARPPEVAPETAAVFEKPQDRILIVRDESIIGAALALGERFGQGFGMHNMTPTHPRVEGVWLRAEGFQFRVNYLEAYGTTFGEEKGFRIDSKYARDSWVPIKESMPQELRRLAPIYFHGMKAKYEIEIVAFDEPVRGLKVFARQEELDGRKLTEIEQIGKVIDLAPGQRLTLTSSSHLRGQGQARVNFERTHVVMSGSDGTILADEPSAGLVDPPGDL